MGVLGDRSSKKGSEVDAYVAGLKNSFASTSVIYESAKRSLGPGPNGVPQVRKAPEVGNLREELHERMRKNVERCGPGSGRSAEKSK